MCLSRGTDKDEQGRTDEKDLLNLARRAAPFFFEKTLCEKEGLGDQVRRKKAPKLRELTVTSRLNQSEHEIGM